MTIEKKIHVNFTAEEVVQELYEKKHHGQVADLCCGLAEVLNEDFKERAAAAREFAEHLSEDGCRFLAEVVCSYHHRNHKV